MLFKLWLIEVFTIDKKWATSLFFTNLATFFFLCRPILNVAVCLIICLIHKSSQNCLTSKWLDKFHSVWLSLFFWLLPLPSRWIRGEKKRGRGRKRCFIVETIFFLVDCWHLNFSIRGCFDCILLDASVISWWWLDHVHLIGSLFFQINSNFSSGGAQIYIYCKRLLIEKLLYCTRQSGTNFFSVGFGHKFCLLCHSQPFTALMVHSTSSGSKKNSATVDLNIV